MLLLLLLLLLFCCRCFVIPLQLVRHIFSLFIFIVVTVTVTVFVVVFLFCLAIVNIDFVLYHHYFSFSLHYDITPIVVFSTTDASNILFLILYTSVPPLPPFVNLFYFKYYIAIFIVAVAEEYILLLYNDITSYYIISIAAQIEFIAADRLVIPSSLCTILFCADITTIYIIFVAAVAAAATLTATYDDDYFDEYNDLPSTAHSLLYSEINVYHIIRRRHRCCCCCYCCSPLLCLPIVDINRPLSVP